MHQQPLLAPDLPNRSSSAGHRSGVTGRIVGFIPPLCIVRSLRTGVDLRRRPASAQGIGSTTAFLPDAGPERRRCWSSFAGATMLISEAKGRLFHTGTAMSAAQYLQCQFGPTRVALKI